jgi:hypothetical protein
MRTRILFTLLLAILLSSAATAQRGHFVHVAGTGTVTNANTNTFYLASDAVDTYEISAVLTCDSLANGIAGTVKLQVANPVAPGTSNTATTWATVETQTLNGAGQSVYLFTHTLRSRRARLVVTSSANPSSATLTLESVLKRVEPIR